VWIKAQFLPFRRIFFQEREALEIFSCTVRTVPHGTFKGVNSHRIVQQAFLGLGQQTPASGIFWVAYEVCSEFSSRLQEVGDRLLGRRSPFIGTLP
jgi:hypothetical protein